MSQKKTHAQFVKELSIISPSIEVLGMYTASTNRVKVRCQTCGCEWSPVPGSLLSGHGCPECAKKTNANKRRKTHDQFVAELSAVNPDIEVVGRYENSATQINVRCRKCGHEWSPIARSIVNTGQGCPVCARAAAAAKRYKTKETFVAEMKEVNPDIEIVGSYRGNKTKIECRCRICGNEWKAAPSNLLSGYGCPRCARTGTSFMEQFLCVFLENVVGENEVLSRDKSAIGRELDIYLPSRKLAIEIGSWYWHINRLESDINKEAECKLRGIDLITIYDCCPETIADDVPAESLLFPFSLAEEEGHVHLRELALSIAQMACVSVSAKPDWDAIEVEASKRALPKTTAEFVTEMAGINPDVEILGEYTGSKAKLACRCRKCGHEWEATPHQLLIGQGCPPCGHRRAVAVAAAQRRKAPEEYRVDFEAANPTLTLLSDYRGSLQRVKVRCNTCGHEWSPRAEAVIRGNGCPVCADNSKRKTKETFLAELAEINPDIEVLGEYTKNSTPIECRCKKCGHIWYPRPSKLLNGRGCPKCAGKMKMAVRCIETGVVYESYAAAAAAMGLSSGDTISAVCKGKRKTAAGHTWEHIQES